MTRLGLACNWDPQTERTWSYIPWSLLGALQRRRDVADVGAHLSRTARAGLRLATARVQGHKLVAQWKYTAFNDAIMKRAVMGRVRETGCDVVLQIQDLADLDVPYFLFQDLSYDVVLHHFHEDQNLLSQFPKLTLSQLERRRDRQRAMYERAQGVFSMSEWFGRQLVELSGLPESKVHVVRPGATGATRRASPIPPRRRADRHRLLFVGSDFVRKGGDVVLDAVALLRRSTHPEVTLTIAGPETWPLAGAVPEGVDFLGRVPVSEIPALYGRHDLFVMPSRFEAFGIVFVEALASGLPCVARDAYAMPDVIRPGENGALVDTDDPHALARAIAEVLADDTVYETTMRQAAGIAAAYSWDRAALTIDEVLLAHGY